MDSTLETLVNNTKTCIGELQKCKKEIRAISSVPRESSTENDAFRKKAGPIIEYFIDNELKLKSMMKGERDIHPSDLGKKSM